MPLYFFDLREGDILARDEEGTELVGMADVQNEAAHALSDMLRDQVIATTGSPAAGELSIEVREGGGSVLHARFAFEIKRMN